MKPALLCLSLVLVTGCTSRDRDDAFDQGAAMTKRVVNSTVSVASDAWKRASEEASKVTPESGRAALQSAEQGLVEAKNKLQPGKRLEEAEAEIARLRAAIDVDRLRADLNDKVDQAQKLESNAGKSVQDVRNRLDAADRDYQDLKAKLASAQSAYDSAKQKVDDLASSIRG